MTYTASSQGAQTNCASVFMASLHTLLVAAGFTYVEEWTSAPKTARIYKSPAASNAFGSDWYLNVYRDADTSTSVKCGVAEVWDTGTKKFRNYAPVNTTRTPTASFAVNDATGVLPDSTTLELSAFNISTAGFSYWLSLNPNRVIIATRVSTTDYGVYAGLYDDLLPIAISPFPLVVIQLAGANCGASTREPATTTSTAAAFAINTANAAGSGSYGPMLGTNDIYLNKPIASRALISSRRITTPLTSGNGWRGLLRDVVMCDISGQVNGDTLAVTQPDTSVKTYTRMGGVLMSWVDQAA